MKMSYFNIESGVICILGVLTNSLNAAVFIHPKMKDISFRYLLAISLGEILYLGMESVIFANNCEDCELKKSYSYQIYYIYLTDYLCRVIALFIIFCEVFLSIQRFMVLLNKEFLNKKSVYYLFFSLLAISFLIYMPANFMDRIVLIENINKNLTIQGYIHERNEFGQSLTGKAIFITITMIRATLGSVVIFILNIFILYEFRKRNRRHNSLNRSTTNRKNNLTLTIMFSSFLFAFGQLPYLIIKCWDIISPQPLAVSITLSIIFFSHSLNIIIYFKFNKLFRKVIVSYFRFIFFCFYNNNNKNNNNNRHSSLSQSIEMICK